MGHAVAVPNPVRQRILITGASSGLGEGMAHRFAAMGRDLALVECGERRRQLVAGVGELGAAGRVVDQRGEGGADAVLPDGRVELVFHYEGSFRRHLDDGDSVKQPEALLVGQMLAPVVLAPAGRAGVAAIRLRPAASRTLLRFPLADVAGRFVDLDGLLPNVASLRQRLAAVFTITRRT